MSSSSKRVNQNDNIKLESPTLLSKLDQLDAQMKLAFPSSNSKKANNDLKSSPSSSSIIKSPTSKSPASLKSFSNIKLPTIIKNEQPIKLETSIQSANLSENKENINEKTIKIETKSIKNEIISPFKEQKCIINIENEADNLINNSIKSNNNLNQQNSPTKISTSVNIQPSNSNIIITTINNTTTVNNTLTTTSKPLSAWKKTKILSKTLSSINVMKSKTTAVSSNSSNQTINNQQNLKIKDDGENQLKKSSSGNLIDNHLNSPLNQIKRRSQEEVTTGLNTARLSTSLSSSCQTSTHNLNEQTSKVNPQSTLQAALNNLNQSTGTYFIPDNYNTTIINQLNKNYLKNIQKQKKAQSDWKSLKSKLIGLGKKENEENITDSGGVGSSKPVDNVESATNANASQRKLSNSNQTTAPADDGIICKKEDLLFLLRNSAIARNKQKRSNKPSLADVVVQLQESKAKKNSTPNNQQKHDKNNIILKNQSDSTDNRSVNSINQIINSEKNNQSILNYDNNSSIKKNKTSSNGRVQFVLSNEPQNSGSSTPTNKIKSSLKKTTSTSQSSSFDKNNLTRQTKSNTINNMNLTKKKVKIYETDQCGVRKALMLQSVKDKNNNENSANSEDSPTSRNQVKISKDESVDEDDKEDEEKHEIKWDESNVVDAAILGDAIAAFLSSITTNASTSNANSSTYSGVNRPTTNEKKVSFKK